MVLSYKKILRFSIKSAKYTRKISFSHLIPTISNELKNNLHKIGVADPTEIQIKVYKQLFLFSQFLLFIMEKM